MGTMPIRKYEKASRSVSRRTMIRKSAATARKKSTSTRDKRGESGQAAEDAETIRAAVDREESDRGREDRKPVPGGLAKRHFREG